MVSATNVSIWFITFGLGLAEFSWCLLQMYLSGSLHLAWDWQSSHGVCYKCIYLVHYIWPGTGRVLMVSATNVSIWFITFGLGLAEFSWCLLQMYLSGSLHLAWDWQSSHGVCYKGIYLVHYIWPVPGKSNEPDRYLCSRHHENSASPRPNVMNQIDTFVADTMRTLPVPGQM